MSTHVADNGEECYYEASRENHIYRDHYGDILDDCRPGVLTLLTSSDCSSSSIIYSELRYTFKYLLNYVCLWQHCKKGQV